MEIHYRPAHKKVAFLSAGSYCMYMLHFFITLDYTHRLRKIVALFDCTGVLLTVCPDLHDGARRHHA